MSTSTFTRNCSTFLPLSFLSVIIGCYCCFIALLILGEPLQVSILAQTIGINTTATVNNKLYEQYLVTTNTLPPLTSTLATTITTGRSPPAQNSSFQQQQPKSFKFTLVAGKLWRFTIKPNSFSSHKEGELRLHKNVSTNSYIIDDDGWFQYNPQQQQLFAWPSLTVKPGTYYFVLLPSGVDIEADSENFIGSLEVVANIVVELIRPVYKELRSDIDLYVDYKFSLDYLHRSQIYPLLLQQIVSVFETISGTTNQSSLQQIALNQTSTVTTTSEVLAQQKSIKLSNKLNEYLLINSTNSPDGELFSLTWSTHPSMVNSTITKISDCRINAINDTITKLSNSSSGYLSDQEKFVIYYSLEAPLVNSQAIVPTDRGNNALKLTLNGPCQGKKIIDELGIPSLKDKNNGIVADKFVRDSNINNLQLSSTSSTNEGTNTSSSTSHPEELDSNFVGQNLPVKLPIDTTTPTPASLPTTPPNTYQVSTTQVSVVENTITEAPLIKTEVPKTLAQAQANKSQEQPKMQPQAKSFANFLDPPDVLMQNPNMTTTVATTSARILNNITDLVLNISNNSTSNAVPILDANSTAESSLNEDLLGILDDIMNYIISLAVPISIIIGVILLASIVFALCNLCIKKRKSKQFQVRNRFDFRYGSERRGFLKNSSKPVILDADQKSISMGGTPQHRPSNNVKRKNNKSSESYLPMQPIASNEYSGSSHHYNVGEAHCDAGVSCDAGGGDCGGGDCGGGD